MRKRITHRRFPFIVIALLCIFSARVTFAQSAAGSNTTTAAQPVPINSQNAISSPLKSDSIALIKKKQGFSNFFARLLGKYKNKIPKDTGIANKKKTDTTKTALEIPHPALLKFSQGEITWTSLYTQGVNLNTGVMVLDILYNMNQHRIVSCWRNEVFPFLPMNSKQNMNASKDWNIIHYASRKVQWIVW